MRALVVLTAVLLITGTQAGFLDSLKQAFSGVGEVLKATGQSLLSQLDTVATQLLNAATKTGLELLSQGTQALALNTASQFTQSGGSRRDLSAILSKVDQFKNDVVDMLKMGEGQLKGVLGNVITAFDRILTQVANFEITPESVHAAIDTIVGAHGSLMNQFLKDLVSSVEGLVGKHFHLVKRNAFTDFFANLGSTLANTFSPVVEGVKSLVTTAGSAIKSTASSLLQAAKDSVSQLGEKLSPHLQTLQTHAATLLQHGTNALQALKDATADILQQTLHNMQPALTGVLETAKNAAGTVVQHLAGSLGAAANTLPATQAPQ